MMKKMLGCALCLVMLLSSVVTFGDEVTAASLLEDVKAMSGELTQGDQEDLVESVLGILNQKASHAKMDQNQKATINELQVLVDAVVDKLDAAYATTVVETYCDTLIAYFDSEQMAVRDIQVATDKLIGLLGKKVVELEGINEEHIRAILKEVTDRNALIQGQVEVSYQQTLKVADLDQMLLSVEKAYRVVNSGFNTYGSFKELGRSLQKQLVLLASTESVDLTLETDMVKRLIKDNIGVSVNHNGMMYQIPTAFLNKHIGDLKIVIKPVAVDGSTSLAVTGGTLKPVVSREVAIGYATNPEMIKVSVPVSALNMGMPDNTCYGLGTQTEKLRADMAYGKLVSEIKATGIVVGGTYQSVYTDLAGHWAEGNITSLLGHGIAVDRQASLYGPNEVMTRGEFTRMLINIIGTKGKSANVFSDVAPGSPYSDIIESVIYYGFTIGVTDDQFAPDTLLTREDMVTLASKMFELKNGYQLDGGFLRFKDMNEIAPYAKEAVQAMEAAGYVSGYDDNTFKPKKTVTKAEAVSVIKKMLK